MLCLCQDEERSFSMASSAGTDVSRQSSRLSSLLSESSTFSCSGEPDDIEPAYNLLRERNAAELVEEAVRLSQENQNVFVTHLENKFLECEEGECKITNGADWPMVEPDHNGGSVAVIVLGTPHDGTFGMKYKKNTRAKKITNFVKKRGLGTRSVIVKNGDKITVPWSSIVKSPVVRIAGWGGPFEGAIGVVKHANVGPNGEHLVSIPTRGMVINVKVPEKQLVRVFQNKDKLRSIFAISLNPSCLNIISGPPSACAPTRWELRQICFHESVGGHQYRSLFGCCWG